MGADALRQKWEDLTPAARVKGAVAVVVCVLAVGWIVYLLWPEGPARVQADPATQAALEVFNTDYAALRAMTLDEVAAAAKSREAAFQKAMKGGTAEEIDAAMSALERSKEVLIEKRHAQGGG
ncbi:MAG: hypothetical protein HBSAPP03_14400 [Phycisphaerae bacterium]|nr:MAG: hypothetical protein HBSAPP03_14400 [Phycisphaerae bacterium]